MPNQALEEPQSSSDLGTEPLSPLGTGSGSSGDTTLCLGGLEDSSEAPRRLGRILCHTCSRIMSQRKQLLSSPILPHDREGRLPF